jgi:hypothetical protein
MNTQFIDLASKRSSTRERFHRYRCTRLGRNQTDDGFLCKHCKNYVSSAAFLSGVQNRNHCPYCLWSCHLDWHAAGDRLSACKSPMKPIGLAVKGTGKKYGSSQGELMLIHLCIECESLSINRIAADDIPQNLLSVFEGSFQIDRATHDSLEYGGIRILGEADNPLVLRQLFGKETSLAESLFQGSIIETSLR